MVSLRIGQTEAISLVLISGIVVSLVGAAYFWGMPMIDKRSANADFLAANSMITDINKKVVSLANAGGGQVDVELNKALTLVPADLNETNNNSLVITYGVRQPIIYPGIEGSTLYIGATNYRDTNEGSGVFGQSSPGIISVEQSNSTITGYTMYTSLRYRKLITTGATTRAYLIKLCADDDLTICTRQITGNSFLSLTFRGTEVVPGNPETVVTKIGVRLG